MSVSCDEQPHTTLGGLEEDRRGLLTFANLPKVERMELSSTGQRTGLREGRTRVLSKAILKKKGTKYQGKHRIRCLLYAPGNNAPQLSLLKSLCVEACALVQHSEDLTQKKGLTLPPQSTAKGTGRQWRKAIHSPTANVKYSV